MDWSTDLIKIRKSDQILRIIRQSLVTDSYPADQKGSVTTHSKNKRTFSELEIRHTCLNCEAYIDIKVNFPLHIALDVACCVWSLKLCWNLELDYRTCTVMHGYARIPHLHIYSRILTDTHEINCSDSHRYHGFSRIPWIHMDSRGYHGFT